MSSSAQLTSSMLREVSARPRFGCKGPGAETWLHEHGLAVPQTPNSWSCESGDILVARLATSEFLVESLAAEHARTRETAASLLDPGKRRAGLVPVLRQDLVLELTGARANDLLLETCNVNFAPLARDAEENTGPLVLTSMIGVGVIVLPRRAGGKLSYTLWCDPSFGHYLYSTLAGIADDLSREAVS
jgi:sarcosine oxidase subunit gamma